MLVNRSCVAEYTNPCDKVHILPILFSTKINEHFFQPYHDENKLHVNDMTMLSTLRLHYTSNTVSLIYEGLKRNTNIRGNSTKNHNHTIQFYFPIQNIMLYYNIIVFIFKWTALDK
jgi:hypothetical protein